MTRWAWFTIRHRRAVLVVTFLLVVVAGVMGHGAAERLDTGNFLNPPNSESSKAARILAEQFHSGDPNVVLLVTARQGSVDSPAVIQEGSALTAEASRLLGAPASSYWTLGSPALRSSDRTKALILARIPGPENQVDKKIGRVAGLLEQHNQIVDVTVTGKAQINRQYQALSKEEASRAEIMAVPVLLLLLLVVFGSAVAAALPLVVAGVTVAFCYLAMQLLAGVTYVHANALNLESVLALGLAVDYSLFVVSRFREELAAGHAPHPAVVRTMQTAGVTVLFSSAAVSVSIGAMGLFPARLNSFASASLAPAIAGGAALLLLPALLAVAGHNVDRLRLIHRGPARGGKGFWLRLATAVMRHPLPIVSGSVLVLLTLGAPFFRVHFSTPDERGLPTGASSRQALQDIRRNFIASDSYAVSIVAPTSGDPATVRTRLTSYATELSVIPGVARVDTYFGTFSDGRLVAAATPTSEHRFSSPTGKGTWLSLVPDADVEPFSAAGEHLVHQVRDLSAPFPVQIGGQSAELVDTKAAVSSRLPLALGFIALVTLIALFLLFGSVLVPVKAVILNLFSLTATLGTMVWVFQEGHGAGLLGFTPTDSLDIFSPLLLFCTAFGLSMDYEVFLLSRIKEEHDRGGDNIYSVAVGLERTGPLVTAAAACLIVVFLCILTGEIWQNKVFSFGMVVAVLVDATVIRGLLVPGFMRLAGNANWWAPRPLRRLHERFGFSETSLELQIPDVPETPSWSHGDEVVRSGVDR